MITRSNALLVLLIAVLAQAPWTLIEPPTPCPDANPGFVQINIFYNSTTTSAPSIKIAHHGDVLKFNLLGKPDVNVEVTGKESDDQWINKNGNEKHFFVCVPSEIDHPHDYEYSVDPDDTPPFEPPLLDPVVRIL
jgi:hypothetical protein